MLDNLKNSQRQRLMTIVSRASRKELEEALTLLKNPPAYQLIRAPETGLIMLRGQVSTNKQLFNMGEASVTRATIRLETGETGTSYALGRDHKKAVMAAYVDALWQVAAWQQFVETHVLKPLELEQETKAQEFSKKVSATKVDFFTMVRGED